MNVKRLIRESGVPNARAVRRRAERLAAQRLTDSEEEFVRLLKRARRKRLL